MRLRTICGALLLLPLLLLSFGPAIFSSTDTAAAVDPPTSCATQTQKCVKGMLFAYWAEHGGVDRWGYPISDEFDEASADGTTHRVQYFERGRLEYHQEFINTPSVILPGLLGQEQFALRYPGGRPASATGDQCFTETNRCISGGFRSYWQQHGGAAQFGLPISDEFNEPNGEQMRQVQYFERARFEYHPEAAGTKDEVTLSLIGNDVFAAKYPNGQSPAATGFAINVWANTKAGMPYPAPVATLAARVYVPDELAGNLTVIDPSTFQVIDRYPTGRTSHHVSPAPDFAHLYVENMGSSTLSEIDTQTGKLTRTIGAAVPYNLYFTTDGTKGIVAAEPNNSLDFYDPHSWGLIQRVRIPCSGVDHMDMSADGRYLIVGCEYDGQVFKVDTAAMRIIGSVRVGGQPIDVKVAPDGALFYVANQSRNGVSIIDPIAMREIGFIPTGAGAHGFVVSRDTNYLYVANRVAGTISVIDFASQNIVNTWNIGGSPDMLQVSPDGSQLWASGRFNGDVYVVDTRNGQLMQRIHTGIAPHGLTYFPQPGIISLGHNGVFR
ncbi:MAG: cytochrome D1 domain-containing protein [Thermomicrobiales bacterium]